MAKADITLTCGTCGREFRHTHICVNRAAADRYEQWAEENISTCPECYKAEQEKLRREKQEANRIQSEADAKAAREAGYPELQGTPKQIAWAETIRREFCEKNSERAELIEWATTSIIKASEWIEIKDTNWAVLIRSKQFKQWKEEREHGVDYTDKEYTRVPKEQLHSGSVSIAIKDGSTVMASYTKDDYFREIVKEAGYRWSSTYSAWIKTINVVDNAADRAAELGNKLLLAGFAISAKDTSLLDKAVNADFVPEPTRIIAYRSAGEYEGWLAIRFPRSEELYQAARRLPGSKYNKGSVLVKVSFWREILDFADIYEFKISEAAMNKIEEYRSGIESIYAVKKETVPEPEDRLKDILSQGNEVIDDLRD